VEEKEQMYKNLSASEFLFRMDDPNFFMAKFLHAYLLPFGKVWLSSVCCPLWQSSKIENLWAVPILSHLWTKVHEILR